MIDNRLTESEHFFSIKVYLMFYIVIVNICTFFCLTTWANGAALIRHIESAVNERFWV